MKRILLYILGIVLLTSCGNDFLNVSPSTSAGADNLIKNLNDLKIATNGVYESLSSGTYYQGEYQFIPELMAELVMEPTWGSKHLKQYYEYNNSKVRSQLSIFRLIYLGIHDINIIIDKAKPLADTKEKQAYIAELRALRALLHFDLVRLYGPLYSNLGKGSIKKDALGIYISTNPINDLRAPFYRNTVAEVYDFIKKEFEEVISYLPTAKRNGFLNQWGAKALLAKVYLYMELNKEAFECAKDIIANSGASLYERNKYVEAWKNEYTSESLFELATSITDNSGYTSLGWICSEKGYKTVVPTDDFIQMKVADPEDVRFKLWVYSSKDKCYYISGKYPGKDGNVKINNPKVIRLSEIYLIAAESAMKIGDPSAGKYLSDLREKRSSTDSRKYDISINIDDILYERAVELFGEGHRAWDMWRNQKEIVRYRTPQEKDDKKHSDNLSEGIIKFDFYQTIMPFSESELVLLPLADRDAQQNPGY